MIEWRFHIDDLAIEEPLNFSDIAMKVTRNEDYHGVIFEASIGGLIFTGAAYDYIMEKDETEGLKAVMIFKAENRCEEDAEFEEVLTGKLNMAKLKSKCGTSCSVTVPIEQKDCTMLITNRFDQKVDLDSLVAFDKITALEDYEFAGFPMTVPAKALEVSTEGNTDRTTSGDTVRFDDYSTGGLFVESIIRPSYDAKINESITSSQLVPEVQFVNVSEIGNNVISPVVLLNQTIDCFDGNFNYTFRFKGIYGLTDLMVFRFIIAKGTPDLIDYPLPIGLEDKPGMEILHREDLTITEESFNIGSFDITFSGSTPLENGQGLWGYIVTEQQSRPEGAEDSITFDPDTYVNINAPMLCPDTGQTQGYMINETLSRVAEAITDGCLKVKSDLYGRIDSKPYASTVDGCGSLRMVNSGLQLRRADNAKLFLSLKDLMEGLNPIDNIGYGMEEDPARPGYDVLRVESVNYFYQTEEILKFDAVPDVETATDEKEHYSGVKYGYEKWEIESIKGLDEVNSNKEGRTSLNAINNTLNIVSKFVSGSYPIEITRQQSFVETGGADTTYDNETFIFCLTRLMYGFEVEQGNVTSPANMYSSGTLLNWRIRPFYNLMRWFKTIAASYPDLGSTDNKVFFTAGTGNLRAQGEMTSIFCKLENGVKAENQDLGINDFISGDDYTPIWRPKNITFSYPLSVGDYKKIKANPYGYISVQCGTGDWLQGYISSITYRPTKGEADFTLKMKW